MLENKFVNGYCEGDRVINVSIVDNMWFFSQLFHFCPPIMTECLEGNFFDGFGKGTIE